jgi:hypothetical protein
MTEWDRKERKYVPIGVGKTIGLKASRGIRQVISMDAKVTSKLLDEIDSAIN